MSDTTFTPRSKTSSIASDEYEVIPCNKFRKSHKKPKCVKKQSKPKTMKKIPVRVLKVKERNHELMEEVKRVTHEKILLERQFNNRTKKILTHINKIGQLISQ
jgi:hypothetical protein